MDTGIGYNQSEAINVATEMEDGLVKLKGAMEENWGSLVNKFRESWIGEDEAAFESSFCTELKKMYANCDIVVGSSMQFIIDAVNAWAEWQSNVAGQFEEGMRVTGVDDLTHNTEELSIFVNSQAFDQSTTRGLTSANAQQNLCDALDTYITSVVSSFDNVYSSINASSAFVGEEQTAAMNDFISGLGDSLKRILSTVDTFKTETVPQLVAAYQSQQSSISNDAKTASQSINDSIDGISNQSK